MTRVIHFASAPKSLCTAQLPDQYDAVLPQSLMNAEPGTQHAHTHPPPMRQRAVPRRWPATLKRPRVSATPHTASIHSCCHVAVPWRCAPNRKGCTALGPAAAQAARTPVSSRYVAALQTRHVSAQWLSQLAWHQVLQACATVSLNPKKPNGIMHLSCRDEQAEVQQDNGCGSQSV